MKTLAWIALALLGMLALLSGQIPAYAAGSILPGEVIVTFAPGSSAEQRTAAIAQRGGRIVEQIAGHEIALVRFDRIAADPSATGDAARDLSADPAIEYAEPNQIRRAADQQPNDPQPAAPGRVLLPLITTGTPAFSPNDPLRDQQYAWGTIGAYQAWASTQGSSAVVIAVIDTGAQLDHPDLQAKLVPGYDFVDSDSTPADGHGHGTHVSGSAAAITNNGEGVAGTCPQCRIMPLRVLNDSGNGSLFDEVQAIYYAADHGAQVINMSLGDISTDQTEADAVNYAWNKGVFLACAAGNQGTNGTPAFYPAAYDRCFAVAATTESDTRAGFSNYGPWVELAAPGSNIFSTWPGSGYTFLSGTSMATPHVAGAAGLLASQGLSNSQIWARLQSSADPIAGTGTYWSAGRLNLLRAVNGQ